MRMIFGMVLLIGIALAGGAVFLAKDQIAQYQIANAQAQEALAKVVPTKTVWVAEKPLVYGQPLTREDVRAVDWPENAIPEGAFHAETELFPEGSEEHRVVLRPIETHEAILAVKVTEPGEDSGLTSRLERGMRAFTIKVDVSSGVSGFLRPGDRVDVYWTGNINIPGQNSNGDVTKLIEAGVRLIAVDQNADARVGEASIARTVTVAVSPAQVAALAQAQSTGALSLSLVGVNDDTVAGAIEVDQRSLLGLVAQEQQAEVQKERVCTIRTRRGAEVVEIPIPCTN
ncbi:MULTISPECIES: Flp pilus assembly protein CpaB [unclassified Sulfitobacter]|jgi:pilus assembly protein CpaB|uniref:Flp pilus assembly protein CpaB n=1 Tax=unclassified Sulfitobacter TaxID=196795 RepID=UPI0007C26F95|nr:MULTISPECIES: Flp pilus assembly protein CpaB [unclassified Sulfitobacter]MAM24851.1 Flp pilus assembly protein CpaB [Paracoccaceae bacterium]KZY04894.1 Flp pilus assembly protein CpaB [Sulfitobacter sp. HI0023]KZY27326.1 Flp pilus assembly protein CpaB [Sulfitobacter sp. HI0040]KZZ69003.1 Flp pilus assembly protein CpaB [Sulfitobacter sp. HI0129]MBO28327.1 Flp pilus assembly protein CpaB [Paracoccaceae bacterium]